MVYSYLVERNLKDKNKNENLATVFLELIEFYGETFNPAKTGINYIDNNTR